MTEFLARPALSKPSLAASLLFCAVVMALVAWLRLGMYAHAAIGIGYSLPIVLVGWTRRRWLVWGMCAAFVAMAGFKFWNNFHSSVLPLHHRIVGLAILMGDLLIVAAIVDMVLRRGLALDRGRRELYRKGQELRISNEGLLERQEMTDTLLKLSRSLTAGLSQEAFTAIADTIHRLLGDSIAIVLWELRGRELAAVGHERFGPGARKSSAPSPATDSPPSSCKNKSWWSSSTRRSVPNCRRCETTKAKHCRPCWAPRSNWRGPSSASWRYTAGRRDPGPTRTSRWSNPSRRRHPSASPLPGFWSRSKTTTSSFKPFSIPCRSESYGPMPGLPD